MSCRVVSCRVSGSEMHGIDAVDDVLSVRCYRKQPQLMGANVCVSVSVCACVFVCVCVRLGLFFFLLRFCADLARPTCVCVCN